MKMLTFGFLIFLCFSVSGQEHEIIRSIYFGGGSYYITESQSHAISNFLDSLPYLENYQISISSHTDNIGGAEYNQWLSQMRSEAVIYQLIEKQIPREKVIIRNNGQFNPYFDNKTHMGRLSNRRVDIIFTPPVF
jgi:outer membrane protein OmpA-like peptidoglycan-associated protein